MAEPLNIIGNHMAAAEVIRQRLRETLDLEEIGGGADLDHANDEGHPNTQALYVEFAGEYPQSGGGLHHVWRVWLIQRRDNPDWEYSYGILRARMICALDDWQPGSDTQTLELLRNMCEIQDYPGLRVDLTAWRLSNLDFTR